MVRGYGSLWDPPPGPAEKDDRDQPHPRVRSTGREFSLTEQIASGLDAPLPQDTVRNRHLARLAGYTPKEYDHWLASGEPPNRLKRTSPGARTSSPGRGGEQVEREALRKRHEEG